MSEFQTGDKVKVLSGSWAGTEFIVESKSEEDVYINGHYMGLFSYLKNVFLERSNK